MNDPEAVARDDFFDSLLGDFLDESGQLLDRLNENLLQLDEWVRSLGDDHDQRCDDELMNDMFRSAHSLKGLSAMLGLSDINNLTHKVENVFDAARKNELVIRGDVVELMFQATDRLVSLVDALKDPDSEPVECDSVIADIAQLLHSVGAERQQTSQADAERTLQEELARVAAEAPPQAAEAEAAAEPSVAAESPSGEGNAGQPTPPASEEPPGPESQIDYFEGLEDEAETPSKYLSIFIDETEMSLDSLTETLLALEGGGSSETGEMLLVISHRIKGSAASLGLNRPAKLAHLMEDLLQNLVDTRRALSPDVTDALLKCADALRHYVEGLKRGNPQSETFNQVAHELLLAEIPLQSKTAEKDQAAAASSQPGGRPREEQDFRIDISDDLREKVKAVTSEPDTTFVGSATFDPELPLVGLKAQLLYEKLANVGEVCFFHPPLETLESVERLDGVSFGLVTEAPPETVCRRLRIAGVGQIAVEPLVPKKPAPPAAGKPAPGPQPGASPSGSAKAGQPAGPAKVRPADGGTRPTETLRVDIERLDQLMGLAGQLVINKARFTQIGESLKAALTNKHSMQSIGNVFVALKKMAGKGTAQGSAADLQTELEHVRGQARRIQTDLEAVRRDVEMLAKVRSSVNDLTEAIHQLDRVSDGIQQSVMDTRMLPIGPLFSRFKRVIRDITRANGKSIKLEISGEKTELDKRMIDELGDPLIHMVRNAADHGVEMPEDREAAGKPRQGTISLDAFHRGNSIIIQVADDGKGLNSEGIRRKAFEKGLHTEAELDKMTPHQIYNLIWEPGLSTAEKVTEVSGRGMGMDIVKSKIEELNGVVDLDSEPGKGTTLTIKLPLTLAILPSLLVDIDGDIFAMPMESVVEIVSVNSSDLSTVHGQWTARVRGRVISAVKLNEIFTFNESETKTDIENREDTTLVIVGEEGREIGLAVDGVLGEEDIVIKSMADNYRNVAGIAGASILGDGRISLILDVATLIEMSSHQTTAPGSEAPGLARRKCHAKS